MSRSEGQFFSDFILLETCIQSSWKPQHVLVRFRPSFTEIKWLKIINVVSLQSPFHFHLAKTTWTVLLKLHIREGKLCTRDLQYSTEDSNTIPLSETCIKKWTECYWQGSFDKPEIWYIIHVHVMGLWSRHHVLVVTLQSHYHITH